MKNTRQGLPQDLVLGAYSVVEPGVKIGRGCLIGHHVVLRRGTVIGNNVRIDDFAVVGRQPMCSCRSAATRPTRLPGAVIDSGAIIGSHTSVYAGCRIGCRALVADHAVIRENVQIGDETIVGCHAVVENGCQVGMGCKLETGAYLCAFSKVADGCFLAPYVVTTNDNELGRGQHTPQDLSGVQLEAGARVGAGAVVLPGRILRQNAVAGAGSVVTQNIPAGQVHVGCPARYLKDAP